MSMVTVLDDFYQRESFMYGGGWVSYEKGVTMGDVRVINGILSKATFITRATFPWRKDRIMWSNVGPDEIRKVDISEKP